MLMKNDTRLFLSWAGAVAGYISGVVMHIWTIIMAFVEGGVYCAILTALLPCISWIYWFVKIINNTGTVMNLYCIASIIMYSLFFGMFFIGTKMLGCDSVDNNETIVHY